MWVGWNWEMNGIGCTCEIHKEPIKVIFKSKKIKHYFKLLRISIFYMLQTCLSLHKVNAMVNECLYSGSSTLDISMVGAQVPYMK